MILLHNSEELYAIRNSLSPYLHSFLVRQFSLLEDEDPQMDVYGNPNFLCTTGTVGIASADETLDNMEVLEETELPISGYRLFVCLNEGMPIDVIKKILGRGDMP